METSARVWSPFQLAIFRDVAEGEGHTVVLARAGCGKTSTIMEALRHVPNGTSTMVCAFNKSIERELAARVQAAGLSVEVKTLHAFGFRAGKAFRCSLNQYKCRDIAERVIGGGDDRREYRNELCKAVSLAKGSLLDNAEDIDSLCEAHGIDTGETAKDRKRFYEDVLTIMDACARDTREVDFDDMIWLPNVLNVRVWQFDRVFVDETQDLNAAQIELMLKACKRDGRVCVVGDDRQAIYSFRGADSRAIPNLTRRLNAKVLPLSVTYRCASKIVDLAKKIVDDFEAAPNAIEGEILDKTDEQMSECARPGDFILSRTNAPLVKHCLALLAKGIPAAIQGRDVSTQLLKVVNKSKAKTIPDLAGWLREWVKRETERMLKRDPDADTTRVTDTAACIDAICEGEHSIAAVVAKIQGLFSDNDETRRVTLSTTHKAKGLERNRVWLLVDTYRPTRNTEESNLWYVAVTRAKESLFMVRTKKEETETRKSLASDNVTSTHARDTKRDMLSDEMVEMLDESEIDRRMVELRSIGA